MSISIVVKSPVSLVVFRDGQVEPPVIVVNSPGETADLAAISDAC